MNTQTKNSLLLLLCSLIWGTAFVAQSAGSGMGAYSFLAGRSWLAVLAYTLQILGQRDLNPAIASLIMCLESVFSALGGWMLLHQNLSAREVFGCVLIFAAVVLAQLPLEMLHRAKKTT